MLWPNRSRSMPAISSPFGPRAGGAYSFHYGTDFIGFSTVHAIAGGRVTLAGWMNNSAGICVAVDIAPGITIVYMHLSRVNVSRGQQVTEGQQIGVAGATGNATGICVHVEVRLNGTSVDPVPYIRARLTGGTPAATPDTEEEEDMPLTDHDVDRIVDGVWSKTMHGGGELADGNKVPDETAAERLRQIRRSTGWSGARILAIFEVVRKGVSGKYHHGDLYRINQEGRNYAKRAVREAAATNAVVDALSTLLADKAGVKSSDILDRVEKATREGVAASLKDAEITFTTDPE